MPKQRNLGEVIPLRCDPATTANIQAVIESGFGKDKSSALRAAVAVTARLLSADPYIYVIQVGGQVQEIFASNEATVAWLEAQGATRRGDEWYTIDEDGEPFTWYEIDKILPK
jgi:hypothetical protein